MLNPCLRYSKDRLRQSGILSSVYSTTGWPGKRNRAPYPDPRQQIEKNPFPRETLRAWGWETGTELSVQRDGDNPSAPVRPAPGHDCVTTCPRGRRSDSASALRRMA
jgi:hypothetical protein